jgi:hypothetical protein
MKTHLHVMVDGFLTPKTRHCLLAVGSFKSKNCFGQSDAHNKLLPNKDKQLSKSSVVFV